MSGISKEAILNKLYLSGIINDAAQLNELYTKNLEKGETFQENQKLTQKVIDNVIALSIKNGFPFNLKEDKLVISINDTTYSSNINNIKSILGKDFLSIVSKASDDVYKVNENDLRSRVLLNSFCGTDEIVIREDEYNKVKAQIDEKLTSQESISAPASASPEPKQIESIKPTEPGTKIESNKKEAAPKSDQEIKANHPGKNKETPYEAAKEVFGHEIKDFTKEDAQAYKKSLNKIYKPIDKTASAPVKEESKQPEPIKKDNKPDLPKKETNNHADRQIQTNTKGRDNFDRKRDKKEKEFQKRNEKKKEAAPVINTYDIDMDEFNQVMDVDIPVSQSSKPNKKKNVKKELNKESEPADFKKILNVPVNPIEKARESVKAEARAEEKSIAKVDQKQQKPVQKAVDPLADLKGIVPETKQIDLPPLYPKASETKTDTASNGLKADDILMDIYKVSFLGKNEEKRFMIFIAPLSMPKTNDTVPIVIAAKTRSNIEITTSSSIAKPSALIGIDGESFIARGMWSGSSFRTILYPQKVNGREIKIEKDQFRPGSKILGHYVGRCGGRAYHILPLSSNNGNDGFVQSFICEERDEQKFAAVVANTGKDFKAFGHTFNISWKDVNLEVSIV